MNEWTSAGVLLGKFPRQSFTKTAALLVSQTTPHTSYQVHPRGVPEKCEPVSFSMLWVISSCHVWSHMWSIHMEWDILDFCGNIFKVSYYWILLNSCTTVVILFSHLGIFCEIAAQNAICFLTPASKGRAEQQAYKFKAGGRKALIPSCSRRMLANYYTMNHKLLRLGSFLSPYIFSYLTHNNPSTCPLFSR